VGISQSDIIDADFETAAELISDGTVGNATFLAAVTVVSTTSGTKTVVIGTPSDGEGILNSKDHPVEAGDFVSITGTSGGLGNGTFTVASVVSDTSFTVVESIGTSTGGLVSFFYRAGAFAIGLNPADMQMTAANVLGTTLKDFDYGNTLQDDPDLVGVTYTPTYTSGKVTRELWAKTSGGLSIKEIDYTYSGSKVATEVRKVFKADGVTVAAQITLTYTFSGSTVTSIAQTRDV
jgi:hypothetical protein